MAGAVAQKVLPLLASRITQAAVATSALRAASTLVTRLKQNHENVPRRSGEAEAAAACRGAGGGARGIATMQAPAAGPPQTSASELLSINPPALELAIQPHLPLSPKGAIIGDPPALFPFNEDAVNPHQRFWLLSDLQDPARAPAVSPLPTAVVSPGGPCSPTQRPFPCWSLHFNDACHNQQLPQQQRDSISSLDGQHQPRWPSEWLRQRPRKEFQPRALLVDAMGTLIETAEPEHKVYESVGQKYGVSLSADEILLRYEKAYCKKWRGSLRYEGEALPFWHHVISESTGCSNPNFTEELHGYYATNSAWRLSDPHAHEAFAAIRQAGIKVAVVSNFDSRLRSVLESLDCMRCFDAVAVSAEVRAEKPNAEIFHAACDMLNVRPEEVVHVGDSRKNDIGGAKAAGCGGAFLWRTDVSSFADVAARLGVDVPRPPSRYYPSFMPRLSANAQLA